MHRLSPLPPDESLRIYLSGKYAAKMQWPWLVACFVLWLGAGFVFWRKLPVISERIRSLHRAVRAFLGLGLLVLSVLGLFGGFLLLGMLSGPEGRIEGVQWAIIAVMGLFFVLAQCVAVSVMLSLTEPDVTNGPTPPSINEGRNS